MTTMITWTSSRRSWTAADIPLYLVLGVCRSGTTAVEKLLTLAGVRAYHQPIKSALLRGITRVELSGDGPVAIKETLGAYSAVTCTFDPLEIVLKNAPNKERLHLVITLKEPFNNFLSWLKMADIAPPRTRAPLSTEELLQNFILSFQTLARTFEASRKLGIKTTVFDYESLKTQPSDRVARILLARLGLDANVYAQELWSSKGSVDSNESGIIHIVPRAPNRLHERLDASSGLQYFEPDIRLLPEDMHQKVKSALGRAGIYEAYARILRNS